MPDPHDVGKLGIIPERGRISGIEKGVDEAGESLKESTLRTCGRGIGNAVIKMDV